MGSENLTADQTDRQTQEYSQTQHKFLSKTAKLGYFLPTGTSMLFEAAVPKIYRCGQCSHIGKIMMWLFLSLCVVICFVSQFTNSEKIPDKDKDGHKKVVYKFVNPWTSKSSGEKTPDAGKDGPKKGVYFIVKGLWEPPLFEDSVHITISVIAFLTIAFSDRRVVDCVLHVHLKQVEELMLSLGIMVLSICSFMSLPFPVKMTGLVPKMEKKDKDQKKTDSSSLQNDKSNGLNAQPKQQEQVNGSNTQPTQEEQLNGSNTQPRPPV